MSNEKIMQTLHPLERKVLHLLDKISDFKELSNKSGLKEVEVMRALQWLQNKNIIKIESEERKEIVLDENGKTYATQGLPERRFLEAIKDEDLNLGKIKEKARLSSEELGVCIGVLKGKAAIIMEKDRVKITEQGLKILNKDSLEETFLKKKFPFGHETLTDEEKYAFENLGKRKKIIKVELVKTKKATLTNLGKELIKEKISDKFIDKLTPELIRNGGWKKEKFRSYDILADVPRVYPGRRHFVNQAIEYVKRIWLDMGFKEMTGPLLQVGFWNFDALFTAQDHPVREMQDTFYIKTPGFGRLPDKKIVERVRNAHENGWTTGSKGWGYKWDPKEAMRNVLRTHTTCLSARTVSNLTEKDLPAKFFVVGKNFRNETLDWSHLFELIQVEGIVVDPDANFRHLVGYLKNFFHKMGYSRVRVRPAYFPYTEPSAEVDVFHPVHKRWFELGGSGIFRPEMTKPLFGKEIPVLAWGLGFDRSILEYYGLNDIRDLYKNDIKQIKEMKLWMK